MEMVLQIQLATDFFKKGISIFVSNNNMIVSFGRR